MVILLQKKQETYLAEKRKNHTRKKMREGVDAMVRRFCGGVEALSTWEIG
jgi:hypothetical protein